jgi:hypothetical protein
VAGEDEDFDVDAWNRRLLDTPSGPADPPRVRTRRVDRGDPVDHAAPVDDADTPLVGEPDDDSFLWGDPLAGTEALTEEGFPAFEHGQWTVEGEIERFGAFGRGAVSARGWRRGVALGLLVLLVLPLVLEAVQLATRMLS